MRRNRRDRLAAMAAAVKLMETGVKMAPLEVYRSSCNDSSAPFSFTIAMTGWEAAEGAFTSLCYNYWTWLYFEAGAVWP